MRRTGWFRVAGPLFFLALAGATSVLGAQEDPAPVIPSPAGHWEGAIIVPGGELGIDVDLTLGEDGTWSGDISIPMQATEDFPLSEVFVEGAEVTFAMAGVPGEPTFKGTVSEDGLTMTGSFTQAGQAMEFRLARNPA
ncbi:hypothetical protein ACFL0I_04590 [Gemmatimonadota bacterium]